MTPFCILRNASCSLSIARKICRPSLIAVVTVTAYQALGCRGVLIGYLL